MLVLINISPLKGQTTPTQFLKDHSLANASFTTLEQQLWDSISLNFPAFSTRLVETANIQSFLNGDQITVAIPGTTDTIHAVGAYHKINSSSDYAWWGSEGQGLGSFGIASNSFGRLIQISHGGKNYIYYPISTRYNVQVELSPSEIIEDEVDLGSSSELTGPPNGDVDACKSIMTVLVLVTDEARDEILDHYQNLTASQQSLLLELFLGLGELTLNVALMNSGIVGKSARFITDSYTQFTFSLFNEISDDYDVLLNDGNAWDIFHAKQADIMVLLTDSRYGTITGGANSAFHAAIVSVGYMGAPRYNLVHEIGHLLNARHNRVSNQGDEADDENCNFGYRFNYVGSGTGYTVMAKMTEANASRVLCFSNPGIEFIGSPIGTDDSNNSAFISKTFCDVANFYELNELELKIDGPSTIFCDGAGTYVPDITLPETGVPGLPPYTYTWKLGEMPFISPNNSGSTIIGNTASVTIQSNDIPFEQFWLFLNILSSDGVMTNDVFTGTNVPCLPDRSEQQTMNIQSDSKISITPNPAINNITLTCGKEIVKYPTKFAILNALGEIVLSGNIVQSQLEIPLKIVSGIYCFQMTSNGCVYSQKFIVLN